VHPWDEISLKVMNKAEEVAGQALPGAQFYYSTPLLCAPSPTGGKIYQIQVFEKPGEGAVVVAVYGSAAAVARGKGILTHVWQAIDGLAGKRRATGQIQKKLDAGYRVVPAPRRISDQDFHAISPAGQKVGAQPVTEGLTLYPLDQKGS